MTENKDQKVISSLKFVKLTTITVIPTGNVKYFKRNSIPRVCVNKMKTHKEKKLVEHKWLMICKLVM